MASLNRCDFIGNIGKIETRYMSNGEAVTNLSIACNKSWKDKNTGEKKEKTQWVNIVMYRKLAEIAEKYLTKGQQIYVSGEMETRQYADKQGIERWITEIIANEMKMLGSKSDSQSKPDQENNQDQSNAGSGIEDLESDVPF